MSKLSSVILLSLASVFFLSACGGNHSSTDQHANLLEFEQKTLEQAKAVEGTLNKSFNKRLGSLQ